MGPLPGVVAGTGTVGIVFGHQVNSGICEWIATAREYATKGYRTLVFNFGGSGWPGRPVLVTTTADVVSAADYLATLGVTRIVLTGASMGGARPWSPGRSTRSPVAAVVSLSGSNQLRTDAEPDRRGSQAECTPAVCRRQARRRRRLRHGGDRDVPAAGRARPAGTVPDGRWRSRRGPVRQPVGGSEHSGHFA